MQQITKKLYECLADIDNDWQVRKRKITTASILSLLLSSSVSRRGFDHIIKAEESNFTPQAIGRARAKLPPDAFKRINVLLQNGNQSGSRVYAIDGSKVHVHPSYAKYGCKPRTNDKPVPRPAKRPIMMLSSMLDVNTQTCRDHILTTHFNERISAMEHMKIAKPGDILLLDRGYYSRKMVCCANENKLRVVFRLKIDAFSGVKQFFNSTKTKQTMLFLNDSMPSSTIFLLKYVIDGKKYVCLTNFDTDANNVRNLYKMRWKVETSFRRLKTNLNLEVSHSMTPKLYLQEVDARILFDTLNMLTNPKNKDSKDSKHVSVTMTYFQNMDKFILVIFGIKVLHEKKLPYKSCYFNNT